MTRREQKERERHIAELYLRKLGIAEELVAGEAPDFRVCRGGRVLGVEVIEYHQPRHPGQPFQRSQVEAEWERIRCQVVQYRRSHRDLDRLSVALSFLALKVPKRRATGQFIQAVHAEIAKVREGRGRERVKIRIGASHPKILREYLTSIEVREVGAYMEWDWNHSFGGVGTSEEELLAILSQKLALARPAGLDEFHLLLFGYGSSIGTFIGLLHREILADWKRLESALTASAFDRFVILGERGLVWSQEGWEEIDAPYAT